MSSKHKLSNVVTQLGTVVTCLQDCISTLGELQTDSFNQQDADAHLGRRESSLDSLTSSRNIGNSNNSNKTQEEKRSSLGEFTPRTCRSKSEETGSHPELEHDELEQREAEQEQEEAEAEQLTAQQKGSNTTTATTTATTASSLQKHREAETASKTQTMVQHTLEKRTHNRSLLVQ